MLETPNKISFAFYGSDEVSIGVLEALAKNGLTPSLIVTNPDRPAGRHFELKETLVKEYALTYDIPAVTPENLIDFNYDSNLGIKLAVVASYGKIIPQDLITKHEYGMLNVHPSLLPKFRGPTPMPTFILSGEMETGVTIILMDEKMDHGPIIAQEKFTPTVNVTYPELRDQLSTLGGELLAKNLATYLNGDLKPIEQDHSVATFCKLLTKTDGEIDLADDPRLSDRKYRAYKDLIGSYFVIKKNSQPLRVKIEEAHLENDQFVITKVTPAGKKPQTWQEFQTNYLK